MFVSRLSFRSSCGISAAILAAAFLAFTAGSALAQEAPPPQQQPGHPMNPPALPRNNPSSQPVAPGTIPAPNESNIPGLSTSTWNPIGPTPLGTGSGADSGRQTGIAVDPTNANNIFITAAGGGVWQTTNGGTAWTPLTDTLALAIGSIAMAPTDDQKLYVGTGEANNSLDSNHGNGILVSNNGGSTWTLENPSGVFSGVTIGQIAVDPTNENTAYAAVGGYGENGNDFTNTGIWKTTDGGTTWTNMTSAASLTSEFAWSAVVVDPNTPTIIYAAQGDIFYGGAVYRSENGGTTWTELTNAPNGTSVGRIALAVSPAANTSGQHVLYVVVEAGTAGTLSYIGRSDNADAATPTFTNLTSGTANFLGSQGWYDIGLGVDATGVVYAAGVSYGSNILRSTNLGVTWNDITVINNVSPHTDHHAIVFDSSNRMLIGNDGGIWRYDSTVPSWTDLNGNLDTIQFQGIGLHPTSATTVVGGSQDNGTELYTANPDWALTDGGDGGFAQFSQTNGSDCYSVHPVGSFGSADFFQSATDGCAGMWTAATTGFVNTNANFYPPFIVDPTNGNHLLIGLDRVYETTTAASSWTPISTPETNGFNNVVNGTTYNVNTVALAPQNGSNPAVIYASTGGGSPSLIFVTSNDGSTWAARNLPTCTATNHYSASCTVNDIATDPNDPTGNTAIAVTSNYTGGGLHVYRTTNAGTSWTDISLAVPSRSADLVRAGRYGSEPHALCFYRNRSLCIGQPLFHVDGLWQRLTERAGPRPRAQPKPAYSCRGNPRTRRLGDPDSRPRHQCEHHHHERQLRYRHRNPDHRHLQHRSQCDRNAPADPRYLSERDGDLCFGIGHYRPDLQLHGGERTNHNRQFHRRSSRLHVDRRSGSKRRFDYRYQQQTRRAHALRTGSRRLAERQQQHRNYGNQFQNHADGHGDPGLLTKSPRTSPTR